MSLRGILILEYIHIHNRLSDTVYKIAHWCTISGWYHLFLFITLVHALIFHLWLLYVILFSAFFTIGYPSGKKNCYVQPLFNLDREQNSSYTLTVEVVFERTKRQASTSNTNATKYIFSKFISLLQSVS